MKDELDFAHDFLRDIIDSVCVGSDHAIAIHDLDLLYELAIRYSDCLE